MTRFQVSYGGEELPEWAECYCCTRHIPAYVHPIPLGMPDGHTLYLCPTTYHAVTTLLKMYDQLGGHPPSEIRRQFPFFARRTARFYWESRKLQQEGNAWTSRS